MNFSEELKTLCRVPIKQLAGYEATEEFRQIFLDHDRLYRSPPGFTEWNTHLRMTFLSGSTTVIMNTYTTKDAVGAKVSEVARDSLIYQAPARYIAKEMCEAFMQTPIPELTKDILEILPYVHIMLPRNVLFDHVGDEVISLIIRAGELYPAVDAKTDEKQRAITKTFFDEEALVPQNMIGAKGIQIVTMTAGGSNFWQEFVDENAKSWHEENVKQKDRSGYQNEATEKVIRVGINSLLVHLYEPELITTDKIETVTRGRGFANSLTKQPLPATWIGKSFRNERQTQKRKKTGEEARISVRSHWRVGHWHSYWTGKGRAERTVKWIKPIYVKGVSVEK
jgi:hypothetical protein